MKCLYCQSKHLNKNGHRRDKQCYICRDCGRQFLESYDSQGYHSSIKEHCLKLYVNGLGFRAIERVTGVNHNSVINWVKQAANSLPKNPDYSEIPEVGQIDELQTFVGKKNKIWIWTAVNKADAGILAWIVGERSAETFEQLWQMIKFWKCFFWVTDGYRVYQAFIADEDHIISQIYMTRVEGENLRLRHYLARFHRQTLCYLKSVEMLRLSIQLLLHYLKYKTIPLLS